jgi:hypothetical protein
LGSTTVSADIDTRQKLKADVSFPTAKIINQNGKDYSIRYAANWGKTSYDCKARIKFKCCLCSSKATETHHAVYSDAAGLIAGREIAGVHIFPLCDRHHDEAHKPENWIHHHSNPVAGNRTTASYYSRLLMGWNGCIRKNQAAIIKVKSKLSRAIAPSLNRNH